MKFGQMHGQHKEDMSFSMHLSGPRHNTIDLRDRIESTKNVLFNLDDQQNQTVFANEGKKFGSPYPHLMDQNVSFQNQPFSRMKSHNFKLNSSQNTKFRKIIKAGSIGQQIIPNDIGVPYKDQDKDDQGNDSNSDNTSDLV